MKVARSRGQPSFFQLSGFSRVRCRDDPRYGLLVVPDEDEVPGFQVGRDLDQFLVVACLTGRDDRVGEGGAGVTVARVSDRLPGDRAAEAVRALQDGKLRVAVQGRGSLMT
jgi:hypothetical protein